MNHWQQPPTPEQERRLKAFLIVMMVWFIALGAMLVGGYLRFR